MRTALTATTSAPRRAPNTVTAPKQSCSSSERSMMSRFSASRRRISPRQAFFSIDRETPRSASTRLAISRPIKKVTYSAVTVASAAPCTFICRPITSHKSSTMLRTLPTTSRITGALAYCTPSSQPSRTRFASDAGALSQRSSRKRLACSSTASLPPTICSARSINGIRKTTIAAPAASASPSGCTSARASRCGSLAPNACAVSPVVLMRRKRSSIKRKLVAVAPTATPPR